MATSFACFSISNAQSMAQSLKPSASIRTARRVRVGSRINLLQRIAIDYFAHALIAASTEAFLAAQFAKVSALAIWQARIIAS